MKSKQRGGELTFIEHQVLSAWQLLLVEFTFPTLRAKYDRAHFTNEEPDH